MKDPFRSSKLCKKKTTSGGLCQKRTVHGPYCWIHSEKYKGLRVKPSRYEGAGYGLYTTKEVHKNQNIDTFRGPTVSQRRVDSFTPAHQALCITNSEGRITDASKTNSCHARFANEAPTKQGVNAIIGETRNEKPNLKAKKEIHPGEEIETDYGSSYPPRPYPHWRQIQGRHNQWGRRRRR